MAKAGFWLRGAKGKLAGATIYKGADGTVMREVVKPKNPRTSRQMYQRAIMATVMRFYALGKVIFDHSFEGKSQGAMSQRHFLSLNAKRLRAILSADLAGNTKRGRVVAPGITTCVPNEYIISQGSYEQSLLSVDAQSGLVSFPAVGQDIETIGQYAAANGLVDGDIYTIIAIGVSPDNFAYEYAPDGGYIQDASVALTHFNYLQLKVKAGTQASDEAVSANTTIGEIFEVVFSGQQVIADGIAEDKLTDGVVFTDLTESPDYASGAIGIIRSHDDLGYRSNSIMQPVGAANWAGITAPYVNLVWQAGTQLGNSDLILEGVNFNEAGGAAAPTLLHTFFGQYADEESEYYMKWIPVNYYSDGSYKVPVVALTQPYVEEGYEMNKGGFATLSVSKVWGPGSEHETPRAPQFCEIPADEEFNIVVINGSIGIPSSVNNVWSEQVQNIHLTQADFKVVHSMNISTDEYDATAGAEAKVYLEQNINTDDFVTYPAE